MQRIRLELKSIRNYILIGALLGALFAGVEYVIRIETNDPQPFIPLIIRAILLGMVIMGSVLTFEALLQRWFFQRTFLYLVGVRTILYSVTISLCLFIANGIWFAINPEFSFTEELINYLQDSMYLVNLLSISLVVIIIVSIVQINSLHRKGELLNFILGRYNTPREVQRIFCFIDLKGSTTIAEKLGHSEFALFLKDYYSDISEAIRKTNAQIYQYVGDEIVLSWSYKEGIKNNNVINCFFHMKQIIADLKENYIEKYGAIPDFKAGLHGGQVVVTWVGELKKEIVYIGDVLNTTARIQEDCKRLSKDFLISGPLLNEFSELGNVQADFVEDAILRGKEEHVKLYSLAKVA